MHSSVLVLFARAMLKSPGQTDLYLVSMGRMVALNLPCGKILGERPETISDLDLGETPRVPGGALRGANPVLRCVLDPKDGRCLSKSRLIFVKLQIQLELRTCSSRIVVSLRFASTQIGFLRPIETTNRLSRLGGMRQPLM